MLSCGKVIVEESAKTETLSDTGTTNLLLETDQRKNSMKTLKASGQIKRTRT